jgi:hypothetical protein
MRISLKILNPFPFKQVEGKDFFYKDWSFTSNKSVELQISKFTPHELVNCSVDLHWWGNDHAGPELDLNFLGYMFNFKIYDHRHWNYEENRWETYEDTLKDENEKSVTEST